MKFDDILDKIVRATNLDRSQILKAEDRYSKLAKMALAKLCYHHLDSREVRKRFGTMFMDKLLTWWDVLLEEEKHLRKIYKSFHEPEQPEERKRPKEVKDVKRKIKKYMNRTGPIHDRAFNICSSVLGIPPTQLKGRKKPADTVRARAVFAYILRKSGQSLASIGRYMDRDHSSIINQLKWIETFKREDPYIELIIDQTDKHFAKDDLISNTEGAKEAR